MKSPCATFVSVILGVFFLGTHGALAGRLLDAYPCPKECECFQRKEGAVLVDVVCNLKALNSRSNFSVIQTHIPSILYVVCFPMLQAELRNYMFKDLNSFIGISFTNCPFSYVPSHVFNGMVSLRHISIDNANNLSFQEGIFENNKKITHLTIVNSDLREMPMICNLQNLQFLNLTNNKVAIFSELGMNCDNNVVLPQLRTIVLSKNVFQYLDTNLGRVAPNIWELDLDDCDLHGIDAEAFLDLPSLGWLDLTNNTLTSLPPGLLINNDKLILLALNHNPLSEIPEGFLERNTRLALLGLTNTMVNDTVWDVLLSVWNLKELQLGQNNLTKVDRSVVYSLVKLEYLDLSRNRIENLNSDIFSKLSELKTLLLGQNAIVNINKYALRDLADLSKLDLSGNRISTLDNEVFSGLQALNVLNISHNNINAVPSMSSFTNLVTIDLSHNGVENITEGAFDDLVSVKEILLSANRIRRVPRNTFSKANTLSKLDLAGNEISVIDKNAFQGLPNLQTLFLNKNELYDIRYVFKNLPSLIRLDLSENFISTPLYDGIFPPSVEHLSLANNNISLIQMYAFYKHDSVRKVDLRFNRIESLDFSSLAMSPSLATPTVVYLAGNPFKCDCKLKWLRDLIDTPPIHGSLFIEDLNSLVCHSGFRLEQETFLPNVLSKNMLCSYQIECNPHTCMCCDFNPCICKYVCPSPCECFRTMNFKDDHFVVCTDKNITSVPSKLPSTTTEVYLDNNNISVLHKRSFFGLLSVEVIYLNLSGIQQIQKMTFAGMSGLRKLFLDHNFLAEIRQEMFKWITNLTELHLEFNSISYIESGSFENLRYLKKVYLDHNRLTSLPSTLMFRESSFTAMTLSGNPWSCDCGHLEQFYLFVLTNSALQDRFSVGCKEPDHPHSTYSLRPSDLKLGPVTSNIVINLDIRYMCPDINITIPEEENRTEERSMTQILVGGPSDHPYFVVIAASLFIIALLCILTFAYRSHVQVYVFSKCGVRLNCAASENEMLYDVFVSYSHKDSEFIERELVPRLEGEGNDLKLCVLNRDVSVAEEADEKIVRSIENSRRTILVLSNNFIDHEWSQYEFQTAHHNALSSRQHALIIVILHDVNPRRLNRVLRLYIKAPHKLQYEDPWFWDKLLYAMPESPVKRLRLDDPRQTMIEQPPDVVPRSFGSSVDDEGYETPVSRSASRQDNEKFSSLESFSLHSVNNIYEEIGPGSKIGPTCDV